MEKTDRIEKMNLAGVRTEDRFLLNRFTLKYKNKAIEEAFKESFFESNLGTGRVCHFLAALFYWIVGMWEAFVAKSFDASMCVIVVVSGTCVFAASFIFSYVRKDLFARYWQLLFSFYIIMTGVLLSFLTIYSKNSFSLLNFPGLLVLLIFCYTFIKLTFPWAFVAGNITVAIYSISIPIFIRVPYEFFSVTLFYIVGINILGLMICYSMDIMSRRDFMMNLLLRESQEETDRINKELEKKVFERTEALNRTNKDLVVSVKREKELVKRLEKDGEILQQSLSSLEQAEKIAKLGYFEYKIETGESYWSKGFYNLMGLDYGSDDFSYDNFRDSLHHEDRTIFDREFEESIEKKRTFDLEFRIVNKKGHILEIQCIADNYKSIEGGLVRGVVQDITDRKEAEASLKKLEGQLIQAQKMEAIGRLAGGVAHDYNNISGVIIGYAELSMTKVSREDPIFRYLTSIFESAVKATNITKQLLAFARKQTIEPKLIDLNTSIENILKMLERLIGESIELSWAPEKELWPVKIDPSQVDQILANLCVNSRDAISDVGKIVIETENKIIDEDYCKEHAGFLPGKFVMIAVSDNGQGMGVEVMENIFEPFFTTKRKGSGTGLGMATVYGIIKQNNGFINVYSEPLKGSTVRVYIPKAEGVVEKQLHDIVADVQSGFGETVLLVEDDRAIMELEKELLTSLGYTVVEAVNPIDAIGLIKNSDLSPQLLLTDVIMPVMNGRELAGKIKELIPDIKVLYMSGYTSNVISHHGVLDEGVNFISKPFTKTDLSIKIREVFSKE